MRAVISTHQGVLYDEEIDYIVVRNQDGEFAMLKDHVPLICVISEGYVRFVISNPLTDIFIIINNGVLDFHDNNVSILAQEAAAGYTLEEATINMETQLFERRKENKQENIDFTVKENELRENLKKAKAGDL
jgi:F-type H+-transporting ATPase subunit epsilon